MTRPRNCPSERDEQVAVIRWARLMEGTWPELWLLHHVPNGGKRDGFTGARLKEEGVVAGVPDLWLPVARGPYHGLVIEMKAADGSVKPEQQRWLDALARQRYLSCVCYSAEAAIAALEAYLGRPEYG